MLDGRARVLNEDGDDWTAPMVRAAHAMLEIALDYQVHRALLTDISAACGPQVLYLGRRSGGVHQVGRGVGAALLARNGIKVVGRGDRPILGLVLHELDPSTPVDRSARDHHETDWYRWHLVDPRTI